MSIYQSEAWKTIQRDIYRKPSFVVTLFGKDYFGTIKIKKFWPLSLKRYQVLWVELPENPDEIKQIIKKIQSEFWNSWTHIFFQLGITTHFKTFSLAESTQELSDSIRNMRTQICHDMQEKYWLQHSFRENLPEAEIVYDLGKSDEELMRDMNKSSAHRIRKGIRSDVVVRELKDSEYDIFWEKWQATADKKWFHTISKSQYKELLCYLFEYNAWAVLVSEYQWEILAGSIMFFADKRLVCLYGFSDRSFAPLSEANSI
jgi:hypothetical protein